MKVVLVLVLGALSAFAQDPSAISAAASACGPKNVQFQAKQDRTQHPMPQRDPEKALVYVAQEIGELQCSRCALTRLVMDGTWVGANQGSSYFFFWVKPGEHHLCMNWQSSLEERSRAIALTHFTAEAGKIYYFRARIFAGHLTYFFDLDPINSDEGKYLVASSAFAVSQPKK